MLESCDDLQQVPLLATKLLCYTMRVGRVLELLLNGPLGVTQDQQALDKARGRN